MLSNYVFKVLSFIARIHLTINKRLIFLRNLHKCVDHHQVCILSSTNKNNFLMYYDTIDHIVHFLWNIH